MNLKNTPTPLFENLSTSPMSISLGICSKPPSLDKVVEHDNVVSGSDDHTVRV